MTRSNWHEINRAYQRILAARTRAERRRAEADYIAALREARRRKEQRP